MNKARQFIKENDIKLGEREGFNYMLTDDDRLFDEVERLLVEYAEQESREIAEEAFEAGRLYRESLLNRLFSPSYEPNFNEWWKSKQEERHETM